MKLIKTEDAVGHVLCHDMTQIIRAQYKDARFRKGHAVTAEDIPVLLSMGKEHLCVWEMTPGMIHENDATERLLSLCGQENMTRSQVKEGKIELKAACDGLFLVDSRRLVAVNSQDEVMIATRKGGTAVAEGTVDCGIIYASDAYSAKLTVAAEATADMCGQVIYPAAVLNTSTQQDAAAAFLQYLQGAEASSEFEKVLFTPLSK